MLTQIAAAFCSCSLIIYWSQEPIPHSASRIRFAKKSEPRRLRPHPEFVGVISERFISISKQGVVMFTNKSNVIGITRRMIIGMLCLVPFGLQAAAPAERIIISGASGQLGELTVKELLKRGVPASDLILVSRTPEKLAEYAKQGASVRFGDLTKPESLAEASSGTRMLLIRSVWAKDSRPERQRGFEAAVSRREACVHLVHRCGYRHPAAQITRVKKAESQRREMDHVAHVYVTESCSRQSMVKSGKDDQPERSQKRAGHS
jgi:hypothetical protein